MMRQENLKKELDGYVGILNKKFMEYLSSLLNLEFSVLKKYINEKDRKALANLEIYKKIAIYNIWNGAINFTNSHQDEKLYYAVDDYKNLEIYASVDKGLSAKVLGFRPNVCDGIGVLNLYQTRDDKTLQKKLENNLKKNLRHFDRRKIVNYSYLQTLTELENAKRRRKNGLNEIEEKRVAIIKKVFDLLCMEYGLNEESFKDGNSLKFNASECAYKRVLVKKQPGLTIKNNIRYL